MVTQESDRADAGIIRQWRRNRVGSAGLLLSIVQLLMHAAWIGITETAARRGHLKDASISDGFAWAVVLLMIGSFAASLVALFLSLYGSIHGRPRTPALIGLAISFFCGTLVTFLLVLTALAGGGR